MTVERIPPKQRADYLWFDTITTRWMDNDVYAHINNVVYYSFFDTAVNTYLIQRGALDIARGSVIGLVVETACRFHDPIAFPEKVTAGIAVTKIGTSSVRYDIGLFKDAMDRTAAAGHFVHVYVDRETRRPSPLPDKLRSAVQSIAHAV